MSRAALQNNLPCPWAPCDFLLRIDAAAERVKTVPAAYGGHLPNDAGPAVALRYDFCDVDQPPNLQKGLLDVEDSIQRKFQG